MMSGIEKLRGLAVFEAIWADGVWREAASQALRETDELLAALSAERTRRKEAETAMSGWGSPLAPLAERIANMVSVLRDTQRTMQANRARAEQAERERDEARMAYNACREEVTLQVERRERAEAEARTLAGSRDRFQVRMERAEANNAALLDSLKAMTQGAYTLDDLELARSRVAANHPGAPMLERMRAGEALADALREYLEPTPPNRVGDLGPVRNALAAYNALKPETK